MIVDVNEYKPCNTLLGLNPGGYLYTSLTALPSTSPITNGTYPAYCADLTGTILDNPLWGNIVYTADFWSSLDPNLPSGVKNLAGGYSIPWDKINYLINHFPSDSWLDIQGAIWNLVHGCSQTGSLYECKPLREAPLYFPVGTTNFNLPLGCPSSNPPVVNITRVQELVNEATANGAGFIPKAGDKLAVVGQIKNCSPTTTCNQYLPYQVIFLPSTCPTCTGIVGDRVWKDINANGVQDDGEPGIENVKVTLTGTDAYGQPISLETTTDANGKYQFQNLCSGTYSVKVDDSTLPPDVAPTSPRSIHGEDNAPLDSNEPTGTSVIISNDSTSNLTVDFGYIPFCTGSIGDTVWADLNSDGLQNTYNGNPEPGISGVTVTLTGTDAYNQVKNLSTVTDINGKYSFSGLCEGPYTIAVTGGVPASFMPTSPTSGTGDDVVPDDSNKPSGTVVNLKDDSFDNPTVDFGYTPKCSGSIGDFVWKDYNKNGNQDANEPGMKGVEVSVSGTNSYGQLVSITVATNDAGFYSIEGLCKGDYTVTVNPSTVESGWIPTSPLQPDGNILTADDSNNPTGTTVSILSDTYANDTIDFGYIPNCTGSIGDFVWHDLNGNGIQDEGESSGLNNVEVLLTGLNEYGQPVSKSTLTGNGGFYLFSGLCKGQYTVSVNSATVTGYLPTSPVSADGNDDNATDSNKAAGTSVKLENDATTNATVDFGYYKAAVIGDFVWEDKNVNGIQDDGEPGIGGVMVKLFACATNTELDTTMTDASGAYSFTVAPGSYYLVFMAPSGFTFTTQGTTGTAGNDSNADEFGKTACLTVASGQTNNTIDAGLYQNAALGNYVWNDYNRNGIQESGEPGISDVTVELYNCDGTFVTSTVTTSNGFYSFTDLPPGSYSVKFIAPAGYTFTDQNLGGNDALDSDADPTSGMTACYTLYSGDTNNTVDAGLYQRASIGDYVWNDLNANGIQDNGEPGIADVTVELYTCAGGFVAKTTTDASGAYHFTDLTPGSYSIKFVTPAGFVFTGRDAGGNDLLDSDADQVTGTTVCITLASGETNNSIDAGLYRQATIGDFVWEDKNFNGIQDNGEPGIPGVTVKLYYCGTTTLAATTTTDANGKYSFTVTPGSYYVVFSAPAGYTFTTPGSDPASAVDSNADATGKTGCITVTSGGSNLTVDAGLYRKAAIGNYVWNDKNGNGIQEAGEPGIAGITVKLYTCGGTTSLATTTTDATGFYEFDNLDPGSYFVKFIAPAGYVFTMKDQGASDALDSDADPATGATACYTLASGVYNDTADAGMYLPSACIGDFVWTDLDKNGIQNSGETGIANVTVKLLSSTGTVLATTATAADGKYSFCGLNPGDYSVQFVLPAGYAFSPKDQGSNDALDSDADMTTGKTVVTTLSPGENDTTWDAGMYATGPGCTYTIGYWKTHSKFGPASYDATWGKLPNGENTLFFDIGKSWFTTLDTAPKNGDAFLILAHQYIGAYLNMLNGADTSTINAALSHAQELLDKYDQAQAMIVGTVREDFIVTAYALDKYNNGLVGPAHCGTTKEQNSVIGDYAWVDGNRNGIQDSGEAGMSGVIVKLFKCDDTFVASTTTSKSGFYTFTTLPGEYYVRFTLPDGYVFAPRDAGTNDLKDSDAESFNGKTSCTLLTPGENDTTWDAGMYPKEVQMAQIGDYVWKDANRNGIQDKGEGGMDGVTVNLRNSAGTVVASTVTRNGGYYLFTVLPGTYSLKFDLPVGYRFTLKDKGTNNAVDSDVDPTTGLTVAITLASGQKDTSWDAGIYEVLTNCTYTQGYWKTHSKYGPAPYDPTWGNIEDTSFFGTNYSWYKSIWAAPQGSNPYLILAHQYIAAYLNGLNGADTSQVTTNLDKAKTLLSTYGTKQSSITGSIKNDFVSTANILDKYNNGLIGPGHCSDETVFSFLPQ